MRSRISLICLLASASLVSAAVASGPRVLSRDALGVPSFVAGELGRLGPGKPEESAVRFLQGFAGQSLSATGEEGFVARRVFEDELGQVHVRVRQLLHGLPVVGAELIVHAEKASGRVLAVNGRFLAGSGQPASAEISAKEALTLAFADAGLFEPELIGAAELTYVVDPESQQARLAWSALVRSEGEDGLSVDRVFADALIGGLVEIQTQLHSALNRRTHTANNTTTLPGTLLITEGGSSTDTVAQTAHNNAGNTYSYYNTRHGRDSLNGSGMNIVSSVHFGSNVNNAAWRNDLQQIWYGDGDGSQFIPLGGALDVVAHELTHGVTQFESMLVYNRESGALNEGLSDIFGAATEAFVLGVSANTWKIGEAVYTPGTSGDALRYMNYPTQDGYSKDFYPERLYP
ncbi:MAG: peptidase M4 family protein, partial [Acidobacteria bacterium]|nr:peptidase M4 family protein [Acidobacteriota bacterium]